MTYETVEESIQSGEPVEFYQFKYGSNSWRFTSADTEEVYLGNTYATAPISRSSVEQGGEMNRSDIQINVPFDNPIAALYQIQPPGQVVNVTIFRKHISDAEVKVIWVGRVLSVEWRGNQAVFTCEAVFTSLRRPGLRRVYSLNCPHDLYGIGCAVNKLTYKAVGTVTGVSGTTINVTEAALKPDGYYDGGYIKWNNGGVLEHRLIVGHTGDALTISFPTVGLAASEQIDMYPGCAHDMTTCDTKYSNILNYGGFAFIPGKNPFGGSNVF